MVQKAADNGADLSKEIHGLIKEILRPLYHAGQTEELLDKSGAMLLKLEQSEQSAVRDNLIAELHGCRAFAFYRQKEFVKTEEEALMAGKNETALRCLAAIAAYHHKDPQMVKFYTEQLPDSPALDNAKTILARKPNDQTPQDEIIERALKWVQIDPWDPLNTANLLNNTGRWLFDHESKQTVVHDENIIAAIGYMQTALGLYGGGLYNLHHRAGAWFWISKFQEKLFGKTAAMVAAETSINLWKEQLVLDITNKNFLNSFNGAKQHLENLKNN